MLTLREQEFGDSPKVLARIGGILYLIIIVLGIVQETVVRERIVVEGDPAASAGNLTSMVPLWRLGIGSEFLLLVCATGLVLILFILLRPVSRDVALLAVFFNLISIAIEGMTALYLVASLVTMGNGGFPPEQLQAMASSSIEMHSYGFGVALIFFGCECLILGYLIIRSGYLPKAVGALMQIAGLCYLTNSFSMILAPDFAKGLLPAILIPAFVGEASLCLWLLFKGVNVERWTLQRRHRSAGAIG